MTRITLIVAAVCVVAACGHSGEPHDAGPDAGTPVVGCDGDARVTAWGTGPTVASTDGAVRVSVVASTPALPARGDNSWTVRVTDGSGAALAGASLAVAADMPDHGHGSTKTPAVTANADGTYTLAPLAFAMPGVWRVQVKVTPAGGAEKVAAVYVCIAG